MSRKPTTEGGGKSTRRPYLPPSWLSGGASWHKCVTLWIRGAKKQHSGLQKPKKTVQERKTHAKFCPEGAQKRPSAQYGRARLREATKTQQNVITERRAHRKHKKGVKQRHERKPLTTPNADWATKFKPFFGICWAIFMENMMK